MKFKPKQIEVAAVHWAGGNMEEIKAIVGPLSTVMVHWLNASSVMVETPTGYHWLLTGDWLVKIGNHFAVWTHADFEAAFDVVEPKVVNE